MDSVDRDPLDKFIFHEVHGDDTAEPKKLRDMTRREGEHVISGDEGGIGHYMEYLGVPDTDPKRLAQFFAGGDEMAFEVNKRDPQTNATFSEDAVLALRNNIVQWMMARLWMRWADTLEPPRFMRVKVIVEWEK